MDFYALLVDKSTRLHYIRAELLLSTHSKNMYFLMIFKKINMNSCIKEFLLTKIILVEV